jgi:RHS repeat-associated protein
MGRRTASVTARGKRTVYVYDDNGNLVDETTPAGGHTHYTYDADNRQITRVDPRGYEAGNTPGQFTWTYGYDASGNQTTVTEPVLPGNTVGNVTTTAYDVRNNKIDEKDALGNITSWRYDSAGRLTSVTGPDAPTCTTGVNCIDLGTVFSVTRGLRASTKYTLDDAGNTRTRTDPLGHPTSYDYDRFGREISTTNPNTKTVTTLYDPDGNLWKKVTARGNAGAGAAGTITRSYDARNLLTGIDYGDATPDVTYTYDNAGRKIEMTDGAGTETYEYYDNDRLWKVARGGEYFEYIYDADGNVTSRRYPDATVHTATYDDDGRIDLLTGGGGVTDFDHNADGSVKAEKLPAANGYTISRTYDQAGRPLSVASTKGAANLVTVTQQLDAVGNPTRITTTRDSTSIPAGLVAAYNFDEGSGTVVTDRTGTNNTATANGAMAWNTTGKTNGSLTYDGVDDRVGVPDANSLDLTNSLTVEAWVYPTAGTTQRTVIEKEAAGSLSYGLIHDGNGRPVARVLLGTNTRSVTSSTALALNTWTHLVMTYDGTTLTLYVNGVATTGNFSGTITASTGAMSIGGNTVRANEWFTGRIDDVRIYNTVRTQTQVQGDSTTPVAAQYGPQLEAFQYDAANRLTRTCLAVTSCTTPGPATGTWTYDAVGNRKTQTRAGMPNNNTNTTYGYDAADQLLTETINGVPTNYGYDHDGNQTGKGTNTTYDYDLDNRMTTAIVSGTTTSYTYDGEGKRVSNAANAVVDTKYTWDTLGELPELALERTPANGAINLYVQTPTTGPLYIQPASGTNYYQHRDIIGSIRAVTNTTGIEQTQYDYDPYGETRSSKTAVGAPALPVRYAGEALDTETGLYHLRARQYDSGPGRFGSRDKQVRAWCDRTETDYSYTDGRPLVSFDPSGLAPSLPSCHNARWQIDTPKKEPMGSLVTFADRERSLYINPRIAGKSKTWSDKSSTWEWTLQAWSGDAKSYDAAGKKDRLVNQKNSTKSGKRYPPHSDKTGFPSENYRTGATVNIKVKGHGEYPSGQGPVRWWANWAIHRCIYY